MTAVIGVIGHPVAHSISPLFQGAALEAAGIDARYEAWDTPPDRLAERIETLRDADCLGANVTIPHKEAVISHLDELDASARRVGAVNTIVNDDGRLTGYNTDGDGFIEALREDASFDPSGRSCLLLGAGGAARAIAFALLDAGATLAIHNRTRERAEHLVDDLANASAAAVDAPEAGDYDCVINTTSVGMEGTGTETQVPLSLDGAAPGALVVDIVYKPEETALLRTASAAGLPILGGLPMLVRQGARSFTLWTGRPAPIDTMFEAAREALADSAS